ncbi:hypothetical protein TNCV_1069371 [Trichonephila clavipes]|nr:hypothetical protein TNCV_1069371 [Trichonephila clavipes]
MEAPRSTCPRTGILYLLPSPANVINPQTATCLYNESGEKSILLSTAKYVFNSGRYEVGFPWKGHTQELNDNFSVAEKRVKSLTRRFIREPTLYIQYSEILKEYESQGIIERVLETEKPTDSIYRTKRSFAKKA